MTHRHARYLLLFYGLFFSVWGTKEWLAERFPMLGATWLLLLIKAAVWVGPVWLWLSRGARVRPWQYLKLNRASGLLWGLGLGALLAGGELGLTYLFGGRLHLDLGWRWLTTPLFALPEEILFRGFLQQLLSEHLGGARANLVQALLFTAIHLPVGLIKGYTLATYLPIFLVGWFLGYLFRRADSLWAPALLHTVYNLFQYMHM